jgi:hypothetical protein
MNVGTLVGTLLEKDAPHRENDIAWSRHRKREIDGAGEATPISGDGGLDRLLERRDRTARLDEK